MTGRAKISLARALSKLGFTSRSQAIPLIRGGRVRVNGKVQTDPDLRIDIERSKVTVDDKALERPAFIYVMLNKPRGLVTSRSDERGRETVFSCLAGSGYPYLTPVGRLDKDSEGLLIFTNDTRWANRITSPESQLEKTYRVEIDTVADEELINLLTTGVIELRAVCRDPEDYANPIEPSGRGGLKIARAIAEAANAAPLERPQTRVFPRPA